jgi:hypothetical protein
VTVTTALARLATVLQTAASASALGGVRATAVYGTPPETVAALPALVHYWDASSFGQWPQQTVPNGSQLETATITCLLLTKEPTMARAHATVLGVIDAYRTVLAANQGLNGTVRQVRLTRASHDEVEYNGSSFHGATITLEADIYFPTTWVE